MCLSSCPLPPFPPPTGDYSVDGFDNVTLESVWCVARGRGRTALCPAL
jgi:hypothetical protein